MKKQILLAGFTALAGLASAQNTFPSTGNAGIGTLSPADLLNVSCNSTMSNPNGGITITQSSTGYGNASLKLINNNTGGHRYDLTSTGTANGGAGSFGIYDYTAIATRFLINPLGYVGINNTSPTAQMHVVGASGIGTGLRSDIASGTAISGNGLGSGNIGSMVGVRGSSNGGANNFGGYFTGLGGVSGVTSYGVYAEVFQPTQGGTNYGIYSTVSVNGNSGLGPNWAGYFNGDVFTTSSSYYPSDMRLKKDIKPLTNSLDIIAKLNPVNYNFNVEANKDLNLPSAKQYGFISQEIKEILPELTQLAINPAKIDQETGKEISPSKEILGLNYNGFIAILAKGIQEQQKQITDLQNQVATLTNERNNTATGISQLSNSANGFELGQNIPNPFSQETTINYTLPSQVKNASLVVYDLSGKQINAFALNQGTSSITLTSDKLAAGIYIYSVMADGKIMDSKRMVVAQK